MAWDIRREGRPWSSEALERYELTPEKIELIDGRLFWSDEDRLTMLALLLENVGVDQAVRLGRPDVWRAAVAALKDDAVGRDSPPIELRRSGAERDDLEIALLVNLRAQQGSLRALLASSSNHWGYEDPVYRFYHQSFKVFSLQQQTETIVASLCDLLPQCPLHPWFLEIVRQGTGRRFTVTDNAQWTRATRPIVEAFFHARFFLDMTVRYAMLDGPPRPLPSGYAALLYLYQLR